ncbi:MAG TPA: PQQ-binding-like beta-propeller repeat protein, partial [Gemmataceae bacterium]|nr:PQQ-binding-like beta-propeller repeat protein [Gemmataceae bacterium]
DGTDIVHLLGATRGRLFVVTRNGVQALATANGQVAWSQPSDGRLPSLGRGVIAGSWLFWPTQYTELPNRAITLSAGNLRRGDETSVLPEPEYFDATMLNPIPAGNWAVGQGCLAVAGLTELVVFVPPDRMPNRFPMDPRPNAKLDDIYLRARIQAYAGRSDAAIESYKQLLVVQAASPAQQNLYSGAWRRLVDSRIQMLSLPRPEQSVPAPAELLTRGEKSLQAKHFGQAADAFRRLLAQKPTYDQRARGLLGLAKSYEAQREYRSAWQTWTTLDTQFTGKYGIPSSKQEPYRSALAIDVPAGSGLPLMQAWSHVAGRIWHVDGADARTDVFFCMHGGQVACRTLTDGTQRWQRPLGFEPSWVGRWHDVVIIAGSDAVQTLRVEDGEPMWSFAAPSRRFQPWRVVDGKPRLEHASAGIVHVERWGDSLLLLDDGRHFYRLDIATGDIAWHYADAAAEMCPIGKAAYEPKLTRVGDSLFVQAIDGQPCWLDAKKPTPVGMKARPWGQPPLVIEGRVIIAGERGRIIAYESKPPQRMAWTYESPFATSLSGDLCRLVGKGPVLLALVPRNDGVDWVRLDPATGKTLWKISAQSLDAIDIESICVGDDSVYYVGGQLLYARSLNDGKLEWTQSLPANVARWGIGYAKDYLTVSPADASLDREFFVVLADPADGRWLQRLACPGARGKGEVIVGPGRILASAGSRVYGFQPLGEE